MIRLPGYSEEQKLQIAKRYLIPRQMNQTGLMPEDCVIPDETLNRIITRYTRESGVRQLERSIGRLMRKVALQFAEGHSDPVTITPDRLLEMLGTEQTSFEQGRKKLPPGWRPVWHGPKPEGMCSMLKRLYCREGASSS